MRLGAAVAATRGQEFVAHEAPQAARRWLKEQGATDGVVRSTLDAQLQRTVAAEVDAQMRELTPQNVRDAAVLVLDNTSGDVLAYVGSSPWTSRAREVDGVTAKRQAGSILKPFLYEYAFMEHRLTEATLLDDSPLEVEVDGGIYQPRNYDKVFRGAVTAREALASSLNVPAVKVLELVGVDAYWQRLKDLGFRVEQEASFFGPSLALGTVDVALEELTRAYRNLALRAEKEAPARTVADILGDRVARSQTFGLENYLSTRFFTAVKTGTSQGMRDNWCVGFSERYTVGVWVGNFGGDSMWNVSGVTGAAPIWMKIMRYLHRNQASRAPALAVKTEPSAELIADALVLAKITYPADGMVAAWDPDLLPEWQGILPEVTPRTAPVALEFDGKPWPRGKSILLQGLARGRHVLILKGPDQKILDQVAFLVGTRLANAQ
jgi:penicillin-binding protein 1C